MSIMSRLASALMVTTGLCGSAMAYAQATPGDTPAGVGAAPQTPPSGEVVGEPDIAPTEDAAEEEVEISVPGGGATESQGIVVTGRRRQNLERNAAQVLSVLSTEQIARTGEGNIAGALGRVTGLSVVGSGYVYVRGLGDRYSLALLNGSPLPSPEPLRRVVPLDLFPSSVIASSLVQKSYSVNYPGEFGGGVINLTTRSVPRDGFLTVGLGVSGDSETTGQLGYYHFGGGDSDWSGFDDGGRDIPPALQEFLDSGVRLSSQTIDSRPIAAQLVSGRTGVVERWKNLPANFSGSLTGARSFDLGGFELGLIGTASYSNTFRTRQALQQSSLNADVSALESDFTQVNTDQRVVVNGLLGVGLNFGDNVIRWTNLYIRDTIKQSRLALGHVQETIADVMRQRTGWYERQLIDTQIVGEFKLAPGLSLDVRGGYANSQREAPFETQIEYVRTNSSADPFGGVFINVLNRQRGDARVTFSDLNEDLWSGGADLGYTVMPGVTVTVGGAVSDTQRFSSRREFFFDAQYPANLTGIGTLRPDILLSPDVILFENPQGQSLFRISLFEADEGNPAFDANLRTYAGYAKANAQILDQLSLDIGVRYEKATQTVDPVQVFTDPGAGTIGTDLRADYWLPAGTLTWEFQPQMQLRLSASKTIARPQFRELINQPYFDPDTNRPYRGNPLLVDSQLYNAEARFEYYYATEQRLSLSGFYKKIKRPIEAFITGGDLVTSYANAPEAQLYGAEVELQKYFDLADWGGWFTGRRGVLIGNYTFTKSKLKVDADDTTQVFGASSTLASDYFQDGAPLTGQSDHIANLQFGLENTEALSQQTILLTYASNRAVSRGLNGRPPQPDVIEHPGLQVDFVAREAVQFLDREVELKLEVRNILGQDHEEFQKSGDNRIDVNSYKVGTTVGLSAAVKF